MERCIVVRYGEISLKGKNRIFFERRLVRNIKDALKKNKISYDSVERLRNRIIIYTKENFDQLRRVFGIIDFGYALKVPCDLESIKKAAKILIKDLKKSHKFRVSGKTIAGNKKFKSIEINKEIGAFIEKETNSKVDLKNFDLDLGVEVINDHAYVFSDRIKGFGGLPVGIEGKVIGIIENKSSILASLLMMKRGTIVVPVAKKKIDISLLDKFSYGFDVKLIKDSNFGKISEENQAIAMVLGDNLGKFNNIKTDLTVLRPLIGFSEKEIKEKLIEFENVC